MAEHVVGFLGRGRHEAHGDRAYVTAPYAMPDGVVDATPLFVEALVRWRHRAVPRALRRVTVLGTAQSAWGALVQAGGGSPEAWLSVAEAEQGAGVDEGHLATTRDVYGAHLAALAGGRVDVALERVPWALDGAEQLALLDVLARRVEPGDTVWMDVSHGFRHLPMIGLVSLLHLQQVRGARIGGLLYGALEAKPKDGPVPVVVLDGLVETLRALVVATSLKASGDVPAFVDALGPALQPHEQAALRRAAWLATTHDLAGLRPGDVRTVRETLQRLRAASGPLGLVAAMVEEALGWIRAPTLSGRQLALARLAARRGQAVYASALLREGLVSEACEAAGRDVGDEQARWASEQALRDGRDPVGRQEDPLEAVACSPSWTFRVVCAVRNQLVHGSEREAGAMPRDPKVRALIEELGRRPERFVAWVERVVAMRG